MANVDPWSRAGLACGLGEERGRVVVGIGGIKGFEDPACAIGADERAAEELRSLQRRRRATGRCAREYVDVVDMPPLEVVEERVDRVEGEADPDRLADERRKV